MTELQMGLIGLGVALVVAVFGYNKWQEMRQRKVAEALLKPREDDILLGGEPAGADAPAGTASGSVPVTPAPRPAERREPVFGEVPAPDDTSVALEEPAAPAISGPEAGERPAGQVPGSLLDPRLEFIVALELVDFRPAADVIGRQQPALERLGKVVHWVGYNDATREWERIGTASELPVRRVRAGLQLVDRAGAVSDADLATFAGAMQELAGELPATADMPSTRLREQAAELDRFCAAVDLEIGINLVSKGTAFTGTKIRALAEAAGMVLGDAGAFVRSDDDGRVQFSLHNLETTPFTPDSIRSVATHGLTFVLDVPRVDHGERVFQQMAELARRFAETLQGTLVDDNRQPLSDVQIDHIRREFIGKPQATMAAYGVPAGSAQALRLFS
ncbi:MAG: cell division protein FtsZ [Betaproteobacteria bacterium]|nr:cell division protein FtsZ [Betaproteobacteria bacterium]